MRRRRRSFVASVWIPGRDGYSNLIALCIIIATAATLNAHGIVRHRDFGSGGRGAATYRRRLRVRGILRRDHRDRDARGPSAGGIRRLCGRGGVPLAERARAADAEAKAFYGTITVSTLIGVAMNFVGVDPVKALFWSAVINGLLAPPLMAVIMLLGTNLR